MDSPACHFILLGGGYFAAAFSANELLIIESNGIGSLITSIVVSNKTALSKAGFDRMCVLGMP